MLSWRIFRNDVKMKDSYDNLHCISFTGPSRFIRRKNQDHKPCKLDRTAWVVLYVLHVLSFNHFKFALKRIRWNWFTSHLISSAWKSVPSEDIWDRDPSWLDWCMPGMSMLSDSFTYLYCCQTQRQEFDFKVQETSSAVLSILEDVKGDRIRS